MTQHGIGGLWRMARLVARRIRDDARVVPFAGLLAGGLAVLALLVSGLHAEPEARLREWRDGLRERPASGQVHIVEIDAASIAALAQWPWPRRMHALAVDRIAAAGAGQLVFDVDFSARSNPADDQALADALGRSGGIVVLPTFSQTHRSDRSGSDASAQIETLPLAMFRQHVAIASVNVRTDPDGRLTRYDHGVVTGGAPRPSLAAMIAGSAGAIGRSFRIDQSIDPDSVPRHSFADIIDPATDLSGLRGKSVLIGATAIELGDRYPVGRHGVLPGVVAQALAAETLIGGTDDGSLGFWPALLAVCALLVAAGRRPGSASRAATLLALVGTPALLLLPLVPEASGLPSFAIVPALVLMIVAAGTMRLLGLARQLAEARLADRVTGLANAEALERMLAEARAPASVAVARIDRYGDLAALLTPAQRGELVARLAERLVLATSGATIYRVDSDALGWIVSDSDAAEIGDRFEAAAAICRPAFDLTGRSVPVGLHFGAASWAGGTDPSAPVAEAAQAAGAAAAAGRRWLWHDAALLADAEQAVRVVADFDQALAGRDIWVAYQPKLSLASGTVSFAEALVRWRHPERGNIPPDRFVPVLEREGKIAELTLYVLARVIEQLCAWNAGGRSLNVAVNVSATLIAEPGFAEAFARQLDAPGFDPRWLTVEVTESAALASPAEAIAVLVALKARGVRISIDDYGTGQSTLSYLQRFPADEIKIDRSFVRSVQTRDADRIMVNSTIELAHALGLKVVAEGVEDQACADALAAMGCDMIQGWLVGRPVDAEAFARQWQIDAMPEPVLAPQWREGEEAHRRAG